jgi:hypothetical protein
MLIFGCGLHLIAGELERDVRAGLAWWRKVQCAPIHRYLAAADPEKSAEVDDGSAHFSSVIDQHIHYAAHILVGGADHFLSEDALDL